MVDRSDDDSPRPLPREWLPEATPPEDAPEWEIRLERILATAEPAFRRLEKWGSHTEATWSTTFGSWWKVASAMATAAVAVLVMVQPAAILRESEDSRVPLSVVAAEGEPFALWAGLGIDADPVLALIALEGRAE